LNQEPNETRTNLIEYL